MATKLHDETEEAAAVPSSPNGAGSLLSRDAILGASDIPRETVAVPEWGGSVIVAGLTGTERDALEAAMLEQKGRDQRVNLANFRAKLISRAVVDADGKRLFSDADAVALGRKSALALQRVFTVAQRLSGLAPDDVEELTAELKGDPSASSGTD